MSAEEKKAALPRLATDCAVFGLDDAGLNMLLIERGIAPQKGRWALPGGFVLAGESVEACARRELQEETGLGDVFLEQLYTFGEVDRDPRGHVVSVAYYALTNIREHHLHASTDASGAAWFPATELPDLAFDHNIIAQAALDRLRGKARYRPIGFELLAKTFTLSELQYLYETLLGEELDKRNFRKKILSLGILKDTGKMERNGPGRPARLYAFDARRYRKLERDGFEMWI